MNKILTLLFCIVIMKSNSQSFTPQSFNGGGGFQSNGNISFSYSVGQSGLTNTSATSNFTLTQGFQQGDIINNYYIAGNIITPLKKPITGTTILFNGMGTIFSNNYTFPIPVNSNALLKATKNNDVQKSNGVNSLDIALIQSHILGKTKLNSPYKIIAADVNGDGKVNSLDIVYMKRLILGLDTTFTNANTKQKRLWAFVDSNYLFTDNTNPFLPLPFYSVKDSISYAGLSFSKTNQTFIGCKLGDVDWSWNPAKPRPLINNTDAVELSYETIQAIKGNQLVIPIKVKHFKDLQGLQFTLSFDAHNLQWQGIKNNTLGLEMGTNHAAEGSVSFVWVDPGNEIVTLEEGSVLLELVFKRINNGQMIMDNGNTNTITLNSSITEIAAYDKDNNEHDIVMKPSLINVSEITKENWVVAPNPTKDGVIHVQMNLKDKKIIVFRLLDNTGRVIMVKEVEGMKGNNYIELREGKIPMGTYYLQAVGVEDEEVKKIVIN